MNNKVYNLTTLSNEDISFIYSIKRQAFLGKMAKSLTYQEVCEEIERRMTYDENHRPLTEEEQAEHQKSLEVLAETETLEDAQNQSPPQMPGA